MNTHKHPEIPRNVDQWMQDMVQRVKRAKAGDLIDRPQGDKPQLINILNAPARVKQIVRVSMFNIHLKYVNILRSTSIA